jgi:hypothetical protein
VPFVSTTNPLLVLDMLPHRRDAVSSSWLPVFRALNVSSFLLLRQASQAQAAFRPSRVPKYVSNERAFIKYVKYLCLCLKRVEPVNMLPRLDLNLWFPPLRVPPPPAIESTPSLEEDSESYYHLLMTRVDEALLLPLEGKGEDG